MSNTPIRRATIADLRAGKGTIQRSMVYVLSIDEAAAANEAGIDMLSINGGIMTPGYREAAGDSFIMSGIAFGTYLNTDDAVRRAFELMEFGADAIYCVAGLRTLARLAEEGVPVVSHVGLVPSKVTWIGGYRAVGKTAHEAKQIWEHVCRLESIGVFGAEIEVVPDAVASEISKRTSLFMISMGAGVGCDAQYLFADDILGLNRGHVPRHAQRYRNLAAEMDRIQRERVEAFREYHGDVLSGRFPQRQHLVTMSPDEQQIFLSVLPTGDQ